MSHRCDDDNIEQFVTLMDHLRDQADDSCLATARLYTDVDIISIVPQLRRSDLRDN